MSQGISRRELLKRAGAGAGAVAAARLLQAPYLMAQTAPTGDKAKLRLAVIGCGGQGRSSHIPPAARENLVAVVDPDDRAVAQALKKAGEEKDVDTAKIKTFNDYRTFFDTMAKEVDAVIIATPNHQHALPALLAMQRGIAVYVEKPMAHTIHEARTMAEFAEKYKVATQMGNQGHSGEGYRRLVEYIEGGAIGQVREVYHYTNRANGGVGPRPAPEPVPAGLNWDNWIGPAPFREFHKELHPHSWHGWYDFGNGSLGNMAAHIMDGAHWALQLDRPSAIEVEEVVGGSDERYPIGTRIRWDYPARGALEPVKVYWFDGQRAGIEKARKGTGPASIDKADGNLPPILAEMEKLTGRTFDDSGTFYVGDKGVMYTATYGGGVRILPEEKHQAFTAPPARIPRVKGTHQENFFAAVRGGAPAVSNFGTASHLTETMLLADLAMRAGKGQKVEWDGEKMASTNRPELNRFLKTEYRQGWKY